MANRFNVWVPGTDDQARKEAAAAHVAELAEQDYEAQVVSAALPVVLDFYGAGSKACEELAPRLAAVAEKYAGKVRFLKVKVEANAALATRLSVKASPTLVFLQGGAEKGERLSGGEIKRTELKARVEAMLGLVPAAGLGLVPAVGAAAAKLQA